MGRKYICDNCGWEYEPPLRSEPRVDPEIYAYGIPDDFACMGCGGHKEYLKEIIEDE